MNRGQKTEDRGQGREKGFTLIEMLVVMAIISLLTGIMVTGINAARRKAKYGKARAEAGDLTKSWKAYWMVYGKWPELFVQSDGNYSNIVMDEAAMNILQGQDTLYNKQELVFSSMATKGDFKDPWGKPYRVDFYLTAVEEVDFYQAGVSFPNRLRCNYGYINP